MEKLSVWETKIFRFGLFLLFLVTFSDYIFSEVWPIIAPLFRH